MSGVIPAEPTALSRCDRPTCPVLAVDIGGTKIAVGLVSSEGELLVHRERPTPSQHAAAVEETITGLVDELIDEAGGKIEDVIGVGSAGPVDVHTGVVNPVNIPSLRMFPVIDIISRRASDVLGRPVSAVLAQDGQCFALAEQWIGGGRGAEAMMGVVVSTGIGAGVVINGRVLQGSSGNAGFLSHVYVEMAGRQLAGSGAFGAVEAYASGPSMVRAALEHGWRPQGVRDARTLTQDARAGEPAAQLAVQDGMRALATAFSSAAALLDLEVIVVGGGVASAGAVILEPLRRHFLELAVYPHLARTQIVASASPRTAGLIGAGRLGWQALDGNADVTID